MRSSRQETQKAPAQSLLDARAERLGPQPTRGTALSDRRRRSRKSNDGQVPVYLCMQNPLPNFDQWEAALEAIPGVVPVFSAEDLATHLRATDTAVVGFMPDSARGLAKQVTHFQRYNPNVQCVAILGPQNVLAFQKVLPLPACDLLVVPADQLTIVTRLFAARQTSLLRADCAKQLVSDEVPELNNRRYYFQQLNERLNEAKKTEKPVTSLILSLDYYQLYFDTYGLEGTLALMRHLATSVRQIVRKHDVVARLADNQIGVIMSNADETGAYNVIRRLMEHLEATPFASGRVQETLSVHGGAAVFQPNDEHTLIQSGDDLVRYANHALYQAVQQTMQAEEEDVELGPHVPLMIFHQDAVSVNF